MSDIDPAELSAYFDGELDAGRRRVVADALASDPALRAEFEALADADAAWRGAAHTAAFTLAVRWPNKKAQVISAPVAAALALMLVVLKLAPKFSDSVALALTVHVVALSLAVLGIIWMTAPERRDRPA